MRPPPAIADTIKPLLLFCFMLVLVIVSAGPTRAETCLRLGATEAVGMVLAGRLHENLHRALNRAGMCHSFIVLPASRMTEMLRHGGVDGEIDRVPTYLEEVSDIAFMVAEPTLRGEAFIISANPGFTGLRDAKEMTLGAVRGFKRHSDLVRYFGKSVEANDYAHAAALLVKGRVSAIPIDEYSLQRFPILDGFRKVKLTDSTLHIFLRKDRAEMGPRVNLALRDYKVHGCRFDMPDGGPNCDVVD